MDTEEPSFPLHIEPTFSARNKKHFDDIVGNNQHVKLAAIGTLSVCLVIILEHKHTRWFRLDKLWHWLLFEKFVF